MRKLITFLLVLTFFAASVIAGPVSAYTTEPGDLFGDIQATELTAEEAVEVEGEGVIGTIVATLIIHYLDPGKAAGDAVRNEQARPNSGFPAWRAELNARGTDVIVTTAIIVAGVLCPF